VRRTRECGDRPRARDDARRRDDATRIDDDARTRGDDRRSRGDDMKMQRRDATCETVENDDATRRATAYRRARRLDIERVSPSASHRAVVVARVGVDAQDALAG